MKRFIDFEYRNKQKDEMVLDRYLWKNSFQLFL